MYVLVFTEENSVFTILIFNGLWKFTTRLQHTLGLILILALIIYGNQAVIDQ